MRIAHLNRISPFAVGNNFFKAEGKGDCFMKMKKIWIGLGIVAAGIGAASAIVGSKQSKAKRVKKKIGMIFYNAGTVMRIISGYFLEGGC